MAKMILWSVSLTLNFFRLQEKKFARKNPFTWSTTYRWLYTKLRNPLKTPLWFDASPFQKHGYGWVVRYPGIIIRTGAFISRKMSSRFRMFGTYLQIEGTWRLSSRYLFRWAARFDRERCSVVALLPWLSIWLGLWRRHCQCSALRTDSRMAGRSLLLWRRRTLRSYVVLLKCDKANQQVECLWVHHWFAYFTLEEL